MTLLSPPAALHEQSSPARKSSGGSRARRFFRGRESDPAWVRPALLTLLVATGLLYLVGLSESGYANSFYAAASQAAGRSWKAWFFGSLDSSNAITVDKPPASLWISGLSVRIFGLSSWSVLAPQALEGVAAVGMLYATVRRWAGASGGLIAGIALALTPAAVLIFRFNNPDALLVLLMTTGAYCVVRATEKASWRWLAGAGVALGFAFLTKMLQGWLVLPGFTLVYLVAAPTTLRRRLGHLITAGIAMTVAAGWWVAAVALWPAASRPYIGGSTDNSVLNLVFGYNGFARLTGGSGSAGGSGGTAGSSFGGATSLFRIFDSEMGFEISWLVPAAIIGSLGGLWLTRGHARTDLTRAGLLLWSGWFVVTALVFDFMKGTVHPYYTVALAPAIAAMLAIGASLAWQHREQFAGRLILAGQTFAAGWWAFILLDRTSGWLPPLRYVILTVAMLSAAGWVLPRHRTGRFAAALAISGLLSGIAGTAAYGIATAATPHSGSIPTVGPSSSGSASGPGGGDGFAGGATAGQTGSGSIEKLLESTSSRWSAAVDGDTTAANLELATNTAVMSVGGFTGTDPSISLAAFKADVTAGTISYFISSGGGVSVGPGGGSSGSTDASVISTWVAAHYTSSTVDGYTVYNLSQPK